MSDIPETQEIETPFTVNRRIPGEYDGLPLVFPASHPEAVGSLGDHAVAWVEGRMLSDRRIRADSLRWWQWLVVQRLLEHRADGSWCWPVSFVSVSRQQGKSELLCELAMWRCAHPGLFGGWPQEVGHSASTVVLSRKVQSSRWFWAQRQGLVVARQLGDSQVVWPDESTWRTMAPENMYGRALDMILADEVWHWDATDFWQATFPTMAERPQAQAVLWSAAHDSPRSLVSTLLGNPAVGVMLWGAPDGVDPGDRGVWRASSAFWSDVRERSMVLAADRPTFAAQWLNRWRVAAGLPWGAAVAARLGLPSHPVWGGGLVGAVESEPDGSLWGVAVSDGLRVECAEVGRVSDALAWLRARGPVSVLAHAAVILQVDSADDLVLVPVVLKDAAAATARLRDRAHEVAWSGPLADRLRGAGVSVSDAGERLDVSRSSGPVAVVKAAAWALWASRSLSQSFFSA